MNTYIYVKKVIFQYNGQEIIIKCEDQDKIINVIEQFSKKINEDVIDLYFIYKEEEFEIDENLSCHDAGNLMDEYIILIAKKFKNELEEKFEYNSLSGNNQSISIFYKLNKDDRKIKIFGKDFVKNNKNKCKIIYQNKEYELREYLDINNNEIKDEKLEIKLTLLSNLTNMSNMFHNCSNLISVPDISKIDTSYVYDMHSLFSGCYSLNQIDNNISKWNTSNVEDINHLFRACNSLMVLPDISNWNTSKIYYMSNVFSLCPKLKELPDISKWDISNACDIKYLFFHCSSLISLPDISKWDISNVFDISHLFFGCLSLISLPDISKWNTKKIKYIDRLFFGCESLLSLPDISKWNTSEIVDMVGIFQNCFSLSSLPDISKWDLPKLEGTIIFFLDNCRSLSSLPDISKWDVSKAKYVSSSLFDNNNSLSFIPDLTKWKMRPDYGKDNGCFNLINNPNFNN